MTCFRSCGSRMLAVALTGAAAFPLATGSAAAQPFRAQPLPAGMTAMSVEPVQWRGGSYGGPRYYVGPRYYGGPRYGYRRGGNRAAIIGGLAVLGTLGVAGAIAAAPPPYYGYGYAPVPGGVPVDPYGNPLGYQTAPAYGYGPGYAPGPAYGYGPPPHGWHRGGNRPGGGVDPARGNR